MKKKIIKAELSAGYRDFLPETMIPRQSILDSIRGVFELYGFSPIETPGIEKEEILTGGDENFSKQLFRISRAEGSDPLALRFDLTVPLARVIAQYPNELKRPFKRYQIGRVWRGERSQAGRYREFTQFDADIVGSDSMMADAEIIAVMYGVMRKLGIENFKIRVNNRKILNGLPEYADFPKEKIGAVLRSIDKLDKKSWGPVGEELEALGLSKDQIDALKKFVTLRGKNSTDALSQLKKLMKVSPLAQEGIKELEEVVAHVGALGVPDDAWVVDFSVARGLGYYTGPVFETTLTDIPEIGSVFSGGRYDGLVERFSPTAVSATGASVGVDRLFAALEKLGKIKKEQTVAKVVVLNFDPVAREYIQEVAAKLRGDGISTDIYLGSEESLKGQLAFALKTGAPIIIIAGEEEMKKKTVQIKNTIERSQEEAKASEAPERVWSILKK